ncbi:MAG TPA: hypothetical protein VFN64_13710 [Burkholderiaceae bacterium]|nr:hypothetical protein [Burkholderiaceae bacterium]
MHLGRTPNLSGTASHALRLVAAVAVLLALVAAATSSAAPAHKTSSAASASAVAPDAAAAAAKCTALIQKGKKLVAVYEKVYKYKFKKVKGKNKFQRKIVHVRQKMKVACSKQCVLMKKKKKKLRPVYVVVKKKVKVPRRGRLVTVKKRVRTYKFAKCKKKNGSSLGTPVTIKLLEDSRAKLDFGAFVREAPITGALKGFVPGGIKLGTDFQINLTTADLRLGRTAVFIDDDCGGQVSAAIRTGDPTAVLLNKTRSSTSTVLANGSVTAQANMTVHLPLEMRNDDLGCNTPYITTGYTDWDQTFFLKGKLDPKLALSRLRLVSAPDLIDVPSCLSPGVPTSPCNGFVIPLPVQISTELYVAITLT